MYHIIGGNSSYARSRRSDVVRTRMTTREMQTFSLDARARKSRVKMRQEECLRFILSFRLSSGMASWHVRVSSLTACHANSFRETDVGQAADDRIHFCHFCFCFENMKGPHLFNPPTVPVMHVLVELVDRRISWIAEDMGSPHDHQTDPGSGNRWAWVAIRGWRNGCWAPRRSRSEQIHQWPL